MSRPTTANTNRNRIYRQTLRGLVAAGVLTLCAAVLGASVLAMTQPEVAGDPSLQTSGTMMAASTEADEMLALIAEITRAREACYAAADCPNLDELMALFTPQARRTEVQRDNSVVQLDGAEALRADHVRVAERFTGRRLETLEMRAHGRNVIAFQINWDPGAATPNPFTSTFRIEDGRVAHWVLVAP